MCGEYKVLNKPPAACAGELNACGEPRTICRRTEEALRLVDERFRSIFRNISAGMVLIHPDGSFIEVNDAFCAFLGYDCCELLKLNVMDITHPDDREGALRRLGEARGGSRQTFNGGKRYLRRDGTTVWGEGTSNWFFDADGNPTYGVAIIQDITERKTAEAALRESEAKFAKAFHAIPTWLVISTLEEGRFIEINEAFERICGYRRDEVIGRASLELGLWADPEERERMVQTLREVREVRGWETTFRGKGGKTFIGEVSAELIEVNGVPCLLTLVNDITARKRAEEDLRLNEARLDALARLNEMEAASEKEITDFALEEAVRLTRSRIGYLAFLDEDESHLVMHSWSKGVMRECAIDDRSHIHPVKSLGLLGEAIRQRRPVITNDYQAPNPVRKGYPDGHVPVIRHMNAPVFEGERIVIVAGVGNKAGDYDETDVRQLTLLMQGMWRLIQRRRSQEELRKWRDIFHCTRMGVVTGLRGSTTFDLVNPAYAEMHGCTVEELIGTNAFDLYPAELRGELWENVRLAHEKGHQVYETWHHRKDGTLFPVMVDITAVRDDEGESIYNIVNVQDITERKRMEEALRESEEKFSKAFRVTPTVLVIATFEEGRYIEVNETFERLIGYRRDEVIGRTSVELNIWESPEDRARVVRMIREKGEVRDLEVNFRSKEGKTYFCLYSGELISVRGELCLLSLVNDITARKRMQEWIEILNTDLASKAMELEIANRELEAFNYSVSHDLRSPLTGINGYCEVITELYGDQLDEQCLRYVREIHGAGKRMAELIAALLNFSRLSRGEMVRETVDLSAIAQMVANRFRMNEPHRRVIFSIAFGVMAEGDAKLLLVVLENLLGNAWKYTGRREEARIEFGAAEIDGLPAYFVRDNGAGFAMADADRLFTPFTRLHRSNEFEGHGIGLATVQRIIQRHGGRVWGEGEPGQGATFYFTLG